MRVAIVGTGYVGLVSGACLADIGHEVVCADVDKGKVDRINAGKSPLHENGLDEIITRNIGRGFRPPRISLRHSQTATCRSSASALRSTGAESISNTCSPLPARSAVFCVTRRSTT